MMSCIDPGQVRRDLESLLRTVTMIVATDLNMQSCSDDDDDDEQEVDDNYNGEDNDDGNDDDDDDGNHD